jgi:YD repeat-containing protein
MVLGISLALNSALAAILFLSVLPSGDAKPASPQTNQQAAGSDAETSHAQPPALSDREKAGLRGPVEECTVESTTPPEGNRPAWKMVYTNKYDRDGKMYQTSYVNNDGSKGTQSLTYDAEGHLLRAVWESKGGTSDTIYDYDTQGRLIGITDPRQWTTSFEYDQGRKTRIVKSKLDASSTDDKSSLGASIGSENVDLFVAPPPGGSVKTSFNDHDQPVEAQVYGPNGDLLKRLTRTYDSKGRVLESSLVIEDAHSILPPDAVQEISAEPGGAEELEKELARFLGDQRVLAHSSYVYDDQGRVIERHDRFGPSGETITKITYNNQGDEAEEIGTTSDAPSSPQPSGTLFKYQYDNFGNWIEKTVGSPSSGSEPPRIWSTDRRTITYY